MSDFKISITDRVLNGLPYAESGQYKVYDTELRGFLAIIGTKTKTFAAEGAYYKAAKRQFFARKKIANLTEMTSREARAAAKEILAAIAKGVHPTRKEEPKEPPVTLRVAWERYRKSHMERKGRADSTIAGYEDHLFRLLPDWLDESLYDLTMAPRIVSDRHNDISDENGPAMANLAMRSVRAIYNHAAKAYIELPAANPTRAVDWNVIKRRNTGMGRKDLDGWFTELHAIQNPIRREYHLFTILSGSRPSALKMAKPEHLNLIDRTLHFPKPKGGEDKAFDIPLSRAMIQCLVRAMRYSRALYPDQSREWIFAAEGVNGHLSDTKEDRTLLSKWGNELRQTYRTVGQAAGISRLDIHLLMNHSTPGVNEGYITRDKLLNDHLRAQQERLSQVIMKSIALQNTEVRAWLASMKANELEGDWCIANGFRPFKSQDPYHAVRMARRRAAKLGLPLPSTRRTKAFNEALASSSKPLDAAYSLVNQAP